MVSRRSRNRTSSKELAQSSEKNSSRLNVMTSESAGAVVRVRCMAASVILGWHVVAPACGRFALGPEQSDKCKAFIEGGKVYQRRMEIFVIVCWCLAFNRRAWW